jgi:hypothetical protein
MKKLLFYLGLFSTVLFCMGFLAKVMHWSGANFSMFGGLAVFCYIFAPLWVRSHLKGAAMSLGGKLSWTTGALSGIAFATGSIFKTLHYPGAGVLMVTGMTAFSLVFLPFLFYSLYYRKNLSA